MGLGRRVGHARHVNLVMGICAYCDQDRKLTREELFPKFLTGRTPTYGAHIDHGRPQKPLQAVTVIRDVCAKCNNEVLGSLDGYAAKLTDRYFGRLEKPVGWNLNAIRIAYSDGC
jgi:hypothetical protein